MNDDGNCAFPVTEQNNANPHTGMSLRDYFAAKALNGYFSNPTSFGPDVPDEAKSNPELVAEISATFAYIVADAMLKARQA